MAQILVGKVKERNQKQNKYNLFRKFKQVWDSDLETTDNLKTHKFKYRSAMWMIWMCPGEHSLSHDNSSPKDKELAGAFSAEEFSSSQIRDCWTSLMKPYYHIEFLSWTFTLKGFNAIILAFLVPMQVECWFIQTKCYAKLKRISVSLHSRIMFKFHVLWNMCIIILLT